MPAADSPAGSSQHPRRAPATAVAMVSTDPGTRLEPLEAANEALARIEAGNVAFRIVLDVTGQR